MGYKKKISQRKKWEQEQLQYLKELGDDPNTCWKEKTQILNKMYPECGKTQKQCRQKYQNFLKVGLDKQSAKNWQNKETDIIFQKIKKHGLSWMKIKNCLIQNPFLKTISTNTLKNYYYCSLRMFTTAVNKALDQSDKLNSKQLSRFIQLMLDKSYSTVKTKQFKEFKELALSTVGIILSRKIEIQYDEACTLYMIVTEFWKQNKQLSKKKLVRRSQTNQHVMRNFINFYKDHLNKAEEQVQSSMHQAEQQSLKVQDNIQEAQHDYYGMVDMAGLPNLFMTPKFQYEYYNLPKYKLNNEKIDLINSQMIKQEKGMKCEQKQQHNVYCYDNMKHKNQSYKQFDNLMIKKQDHDGHVLDNQVVIKQQQQFIQVDQIGMYLDQRL